MRDFEGSTLWQISEYERMREGGAGVAFQGDGPSLLPTTLLTDLRQLQADPTANDVLEVMAACLRNREAALLYLEYGGLVWPLTLFPRQLLYYSPCDASQLSATAGLSTLRLLSAKHPTCVHPATRSTSALRAQRGTDRWAPCSGRWHSRARAGRC